MLISLLRSAAESAATAPFLLATGIVRSYADVLDDAARMASVLRRRGLERFGCRLADSPESIVLWLAASWIGAEPCFLSRDASDAEIDEIAGRLGLDPIVSDAPSELRGARRIALAELTEAAKTARPAEESPSADSSVVILTTGTTGVPKGVRYRWSSLAAQVRPSSNPSPARWLLAYHLSHFAGVQMFLHVLVNRGSLVIPASPRPIDALAAIEQFGVTRVSATPTFWRVLLGQLPQERARSLPLEQITLGAEAVPADLIEELRRLFPSARVSQVFAATEVGSCLAVSDGKPGLPASILERDESADVRFRVVDGELQIKARHGMLGYVGDGTAAAAGWRATGDLVERRGDRLLFVGRKSETINVGGVKVHPLPVEQRVQSIPGVRLARAYGKRNPVTGEIVAVDVVADEGVEPRELEAHVRSACRTLPRAAQPRFVRIVDALETRNQKLVRRRT